MNYCSAFVHLFVLLSSVVRYHPDSERMLFWAAKKNGLPFADVFLSMFFGDHSEVVTCIQFVALVAFNKLVINKVAG